MFERYTEKARRVIFFARYEASQLGQPYIETEHILLGLLREDKALTNRFLRAHGAVESIRKQIEKNVTIGERISTSVDLPLSNESKRVLAYAAEEAERLGHKHIGTEHLLLGLLREEDCFAGQILNERGIELEKLREELARVPREKLESTGRTAKREYMNILTGLSTDLTQKAGEGELQPVVAREAELESLIEVLCKKERRNPILLGKHSVGKRTIVEALAQRIAEGRVPAQLAEARIVAVATEVLTGWLRGRETFEDLSGLIGAVANSPNLVLFVDGLFGEKAGGQELLDTFRFAMQETETRCIAATTGEDYAQLCALNPLLERVFTPLHIRALDAASSLQVLKVRKEGLQKFHEVTFADDALSCAIERADSYLKDRLLPGKALELLDAAGAAIKVRQQAMPAEISEAKKKIAFITLRMDAAIQAHEFEKAKFYSEEERRERENLRELQKIHGLDDTVVAAVTRADVELIIANWNAYPYSQ